MMLLFQKMLGVKYSHIGFWFHRFSHIIQAMKNYLKEAVFEGVGLPKTFALFRENTCFFLSQNKEGDITQ